MEDFLECNVLNQLSEMEKHCVEKEVELGEVEDVLRRLEKKKTSGSDGFPNELYQRFWDTVKEDLKLLVSRILQKGSMGHHLNRNIIVVLPKWDNPTTVGDYRPISLLGRVYKIVAKILVN